MTQATSDRPILVVIDSFHKINADGTEANLTEPARIKKHSGKLKALAQTHCITIMASLELNKGAAINMEPQLLHITESRKIEYDFDVISTVYNHYYDMDGDTDQVIVLPNGQLKPLIKMNIRKSKEGGSGPVFFALDQNNFKLTCYSIEEIRRLTDTSEVVPVNLGRDKLIPPDNGMLISSKQDPWNFND